MRKWAIFAALLGTTLVLLNTPPPASSPPGAITLVQPAYGVNAGCTPTCATAAFGSNTTAGNSILACIVGHQASGATNSLVSISGQGTFTILPFSLVNTGMTTNYTNLWVECGIATGIAGGATTAETCHVTLNSGGACIAWEVTPNTGTTLYSTAIVPSGTAVSAGSATSTENGAFAVTLFMEDDGAGAGTFFSAVGSGWTLGSQGGGGSSDWGHQYQAQSSAGTLTGNATAARAGVTAASMVVLQP